MSNPVMIAATRIISSVWTLEYKLLGDNRIEIISHSRDNKYGYEHEKHLPRFTLIEEKHPDLGPRTVVRAKIFEVPMKYGEVTKVTEYVVANPQYIFSYPYHRDGEVMGLDGDGNLLVWDSSKAEVYNSGFTPDQFGVENLTDKERSRLPEQSERKFFRTIFEIEILSQEALPDTMTLEDLDFEMREGGCSGKITKTEGEEIGAFTCSKSLIKQGTDPELFRLDVLGRDIEV